MFVPAIYSPTISNIYNKIILFFGCFTLYTHSQIQHSILLFPVLLLTQKQEMYVNVFKLSIAGDLAVVRSGAIFPLSGFSAALTAAW